MIMHFNTVSNGDLNFCALQSLISTLVFMQLVCAIF